MGQFIQQNSVYIRDLISVLIVMTLLSTANTVGKLTYNTTILDEKFDGSRLLKGITKYLSSSFMVVTLSLAYLIFLYIGMVDESMVDPMILMKAAAVFHFLKLSKSVAEVLGVVNLLPAKVDQKIQNEKIESEKVTETIPEPIIEDKVEISPEEKIDEMFSDSMMEGYIDLNNVEIITNERR